jgi:hypothetical protein
MSKPAYINQFNSVVVKFLEDLYTILPDEKDIYIFQNQIETLTMFNKSILIDNFIEKVYKYKKNILDKDENFFLTNELDIEENDISKAIHLKSLWKNKLRNENKEIIWKYFKLLIVISDKYTNA